MTTQYDHIPHVEYRGARIYNHEAKIETLKTKAYWTVSQVQKQFKCGHYGALHLIGYAVSVGVLFGPSLSRGVDKYMVSLNE